jgi:hypothetical protein
MAAEDRQEGQETFDQKAPPAKVADVEAVATPEAQNPAEQKQQFAGLADLDGIKRSWSLQGLIVIWISALLMSFAASLNNQTANSFAPYATSSFASAPLLGTIAVVQAVVSAGLLLLIPGTMTDPC